MATASLSIDLDAIAANWRALDKASASGVQTAAVVKADAYGLGAKRVSKALARAGARRFFVAAAEEGAAVRQALGPGPQINILSGHMAGDTDMICDLDLTPMLNSLEQVTRHLEALPGHAFGVQLNTGMNRLGMDELEWDAVAPYVLDAGPELLMSHLACADEPDHPLNDAQLRRFHAMTDGAAVPRSLAATGGILMGPRYHFDLTRPGIGLYGGWPYEAALPVVTLSIPVVQTREIAAGQPVGYSCAWVAEQPSVIATLAAGYADALRAELSINGVSVHTIYPGSVATNVSRNALTAGGEKRGKSDPAIDNGIPADVAAREMLDAIAAGTREIIIERTLALSGFGVSLARLKVIVLMVLPKLGVPLGDFKLGVGFENHTCHPSVAGRIRLHVTRVYPAAVLRSANVKKLVYGT